MDRMSTDGRRKDSATDGTNWAQMKMKRKGLVPNLFSFICATSVPHLWLNWIEFAFVGVNG